jgi:tRNA (guanine37-N1)-methyltransferase
MRVDILTLFPNIFSGPFEESIIKRAREKGLIEIRVVNIRDYTTDKHRTADDRPFGGGPGMVLKPEPIFAAVEELKGEGRARVILTTPQGRLFTQDYARDLAKEDHIIIICGRYEGVDERVREALVTDAISIGDYVLTGGELAAMVIVDAVARLIPGVLGNEDSITEDSFWRGLLGYPQYTRPASFRGMRVPDVLLSGNHAMIARWRRKESLRRTLYYRPELLQKAKLEEEDIKLLEEIKREMGEGR